MFYQSPESAQLTNAKQTANMLRRLQQLILCTCIHYRTLEHYIALQSVWFFFFFVVAEKKSPLEIGNPSYGSVQHLSPEMSSWSPYYVYEHFIEHPRWRKIMSGFQKIWIFDLHCWLEICWKQVTCEERFRLPLTPWKMARMLGMNLWGHRWFDTAMFNMLLPNNWDYLQHVVK